MALQVATPKTQSAPAPAQPAPARESKSAPRRGSSWFGRLFLLTFVLGGLVLAGPWIVAATPLRHQVVNWLVPELAPGTVVTSAQFGWLSPVLMNGIMLKDDEGRTFFSAESITSSSSLLDLVKSPGKLGEFTIEKPVLNLIVGEGQNNLTSLGERLGKKPPAGIQPHVTVRLKDGTVTFSDPAGKKLAELADLQASYASEPAADPNNKVALDCKVTHPTPDGSVHLAGQWHFVPKTRESHGGQLTAKVLGFPLDMLQPALADSMHLVALAGVTDLELETKLVPIEGGSLATEVDLRLPRLQFESLKKGAVAPTRWFNQAPIEFGLRGQVNPAKEFAHIDSAALRSELANFRFQGNVSDWSGDLDCDITGDADYDLQLLLARLPVHLQQEVRIEGAQLRKLVVKGPLRRLAAPVPPAPEIAQAAANGAPTPAAIPASGTESGGLPPAPLPGQPNPLNLATPETPLPSFEIGAELSWTAATAFGIRSDNGQIRVATQDNILSVDPLHVPVTTGQLRVRPSIPLDRQPFTVHIGGGPVLENVQMTEEMCRSWLMYIAPLVSNATAVEGRFSLGLDQASLPLDAPGRGVASGKLLMQEGRVGPGPIADEVLRGVGTILQISGGRLDPEAMVWMNMPRQEIQFQMKEGRMSHGLVVFNVGGVVVTSQGSVGTVDRTLDLLVDFRLPQEWLQRGPILAALVGEGLQIKVGGTLDKPQVDNKPLAEFGKRAAVKAGAGAILDLIKRRQERRGLR